MGNKTAEEAHAVLEKPDVKVTNQKDKEVQLPKLQKLDTFAKSVVADVVRGSEGGAYSPLGVRPRHGWLGPLLVTSVGEAVPTPRAFPTPQVEARR